MQGDAGPAETSTLKLAHTEPEQAATTLPATPTFQRGQFTFNRRFFETKFPGFFGVVRREADKDMVLAIKASRGKFVGNRITRIAANDLHLEIHKGHASEEVMIPFSEIQEIELKHKDRPLPPGAGYPRPRWHSAQCAPGRNFEGYIGRGRNLLFEVHARR